MDDYVQTKGYYNAHNNSGPRKAICRQRPLSTSNKTKTHYMGQISQK